jgi:putative transcriptional regulator
MRFKMDILEKLKDCGYSTYKIRKDKLLSESTVQKLRKGEGVSWENISMLCTLLNCQPGDIMEYVPDSEGD